MGGKGTEPPQGPITKKEGEGGTGLVGGGHGKTTQLDLAVLIANAISDPLGKIQDQLISPEKKDGKSGGLPEGGSKTASGSEVIQSIYIAVKAVSAMLAFSAVMSAGKSTLKNLGSQATKGATNALTNAEKALLRFEARDLMKATGRKLMPWQDVHHRIPLQFSHLLQDKGSQAFRGMLNPNRIENLRVVNRVSHMRVHQHWRHFTNNYVINAKNIVWAEQKIAKAWKWGAM